MCKKCETKGCNNKVDHPEDDLCYGCQADYSHRCLWGSGIPRNSDQPS